MDNIDSYIIEEFKINLFLANILSLIIGILGVLLFGFIFIITSEQNFEVNLIKYIQLFNIDNRKSIYIFILLLIIGLFLHEFIHGITWMNFTNKKLKSIKFGVFWKTCTPFCSCTEILPINKYKIGVIMPLIILGFIPVILSIIFISKILLLFGIVFIAAATSDIIAFYKLLQEKKDSQIINHPSSIGWYIYRIK